MGVRRGRDRVSLPLRVAWARLGDKAPWDLLAHEIVWVMLGAKTSQGLVGPLLPEWWGGGKEQGFSHCPPCALAGGWGGGQLGQPMLCVDKFLEGETARGRIETSHQIGAIFL